MTSTAKVIDMGTMRKKETSRKTTHRQSSRYQDNEQQINKTKLDTGNSGSVIGVCSRFLLQDSRHKR